MDRFLKKKETKSLTQSFAEADTVCVWGPAGIGKTHFIEQTGGIHLTEETLRSKQATLEFMERVRSTDRDVLIDNFESVEDLVGLRELKGCPSGGRLFLTAMGPVKLPFPVTNYQLPVPTPEKIIEIVLGKKPTASPALVKQLADEAGGSVRYVLQGVEFPSDARDLFTDPKTDLEILLVKGVPGRRPRWDSLHEHGYSWAVVQENYIDAPLNLDQLADLAESMSRADVIDEYIYRSGQWDLATYFAIEAVFGPAFKIKKTLKKLRPGSIWTKYQNACMKRKKLEALFQKLGSRDMERLPLVALRPQDYPTITPQEISFMKKICTFK